MGYALAVKLHVIQIVDPAKLSLNVTGGPSPGAMTSQLTMSRSKLFSSTMILA